MSGTYDVFTGTVPGGTSRYTSLLFSNWEAELRSRWAARHPAVVASVQAR